MANRNRNFRRLVVTIGLVISGLLGLDAVAARAQFTDNLPCSTRRTRNSCTAECTTENFLLECSCLFDNRLHNSQDATCPPGGPCCWNMPCEKWDGTSAFECLRGGGSPDGITAKHCGWTPEEGGGTCRCVPPLVRGDHPLEDFVNPEVYPDTLEAPFDCRCPFTTDEQWLRLDVCNPPGVSKLSVKLNFAKPSADSIGLKGTLAVPAGFAVAGATLEVSIGGVVKTFTLDAKGKSTVGDDKAQLTVKAKKGVVLAQDAKLSVKLGKGSFAATLVDEGLVDATVKDVAVTMPVEIKLNDTMYARAQTRTYTAKAGKTGKTGPLVAPPAAKRVFATSTTQTGGFGGIVGADAICTARAAAASLDGVFKAWVSTTDASPASTFTHATGPYRLVDGTKIADDWNDVVDGSLDHAINESESGSTVIGDVWTGTDTSGAVAAATCNAWTTGTSSASGQCGSTQSTVKWTEEPSLSPCDCDTPLRLYCFEQ